MILPVALPQGKRHRMGQIQSRRARKVSSQLTRYKADWVDALPRSEYHRTPKITGRPKSS